MEMLEKIALPDVTLASDGDCWFCKQEPEEDQTTLANEEDESPPSPEGKAAGAENEETNNASALGKNLEDEPEWKISHSLHEEDPIADGETTKIVPAAHHLLPGNASVNKAEALHKFMLWKGKNDLNFSGPIGYNINNAKNGVWLPGNYAVREGTRFEKTWSEFKKGFQNQYAKQAMKNAGSIQFHDAHRRYNSNVKKTLLDIAEKLDAKSNKGEKCPVCGKDIPEDANKKKRPPYGLVQRLNYLSTEHQKALKHPAQNQKAISNGYYTSSRVKSVYGHGPKESI